MAEVGATDKDVAAYTGIDPAQVWKLRVGRTQHPRLDTVELLVQWARAEAKRKGLPKGKRLVVLPGLVA